jgi:hypothetical protein
VSEKPAAISGAWTPWKVRGLRHCGSRNGFEVPTKPRGVAPTILALLFALIALSNFLKPFHLFPNDGFVFLGTKLTGTANAVVAPLFGIILLVYAYGVWAMRKFALPVAYICVLCVILNMVLFTMKNGDTRPLPFINIVVGTGVPLATAIVLTRRRAELA